MEKAEYRCALGHEWSSTTVEQGAPCPKCRCASQLLAVYDVVTEKADDLTQGLSTYHEPIIAGVKRTEGRQ